MSRRLSAAGAGAGDAALPGGVLTRGAMNYRDSKVIEVIVTVTLEGNGTPESPCREVHTYTDLEGNLLARHDPMPDLVAPLGCTEISTCSVCCCDPGN